MYGNRTITNGEKCAATSEIPRDSSADILQTSSAQSGNFYLNVSWYIEIISTVSTVNLLVEKLINVEFVLYNTYKLYIAI